MAHYAHVVDGVVKTVYVVANGVLLGENEVEQEDLGAAFLSGLYGFPAEEFVQASYNGNMRAHYPGIGFTYDEDRDAFIPPKPFESWVLDEATCRWQAPIEYPTDGADYVWDEEAGNWSQVTGE